MFKTVIIAMLCSLLMCSLFYMAVKKPDIASVDILLLTTQFIKKEAQIQHTPSERKLAIQQFSHQLEEALNTLAKTKGVILIPKEAVIKGCPDYTKILRGLVGLEAQA